MQTSVVDFKCVHLRQVLGLGLDVDYLACPNLENDLMAQAHLFCRPLFKRQSNMSHVSVFWWGSGIFKFFKLKRYLETSSALWWF